MILDELSLQNVGVFGERQIIKLSPPANGRSVVLIGGLNGTGKTTIRDALFLVLYGPFALGSRGTRNYEKYLASLSHRNAAGEESVVELRFRLQRDGKSERYVLRRSWLTTSRGVREDFRASREGEWDRTLA